MSRNKEVIAKMERRWRMVEYCRDCMARLQKFGGRLESVIAACHYMAMKKVFPKQAPRIVK